MALLLTAAIFLSLLTTLWHNVVSHPSFLPQLSNSTSVHRLVKERPPLHSHHHIHSHLRTIHSHRRPGLACHYQGHYYQAGSRFNPDPCTSCHCPQHAFRALCTIEDCLFEPNCIRYEKSPEQCCGVCKEYGCRHTNSTVYKLGEIVVDTVCELCTCPEHGGKTVCKLKEDCPPVNCVNPVPVPGSCCMHCPIGANCWLGNKVIPAGQKFHTSDCRVCECPIRHRTKTSWEGGPQAMCVVMGC